nr:proline-rich protein 18-like isoform X2 [Camelus dromedarius]
MTASGPRDPSPLPPPPRRPRPRLPAPEQESAAGRPDPPKGPEAGGTRVPGPWGRTPSRKLPQVQSIDTAPRGEGAPSFSRAQRPGSSGRRPSLASDPAPGRGAARAPALRREAAGAGKRGRWAGESGGASCRGPGEEPRWREPLPQARAEDLTDPDCHSQVVSGPQDPSPSSLPSRRWPSRPPPLCTSPQLDLGKYFLFNQEMARRGRWQICVYSFSFSSLPLCKYPLPSWKINFQPC